MFERIRNLIRPPANGSSAGEIPDDGETALSSQIHQVKVAEGDPLLGYILNHPGILEVDELDLRDSPALQALKEDGVKISVPLVNEGKLIGMLNLGARMSDQEYSSDDRRLLNALSVQVSPSMRVAQLARRRQTEAQERERIANELRLARMVQQTLLPEEVPALPGWTIEPFWQPAQAVSGDFYDFLPLPDGRFAFYVADVTGKGMPAALVMADTRRTLRILAERFVRPGQVLHQANQQLSPDIPPQMFSTCLYMLLDPAAGTLLIANAGHNLPCLRHNDGEVEELSARGMPLGMLPDMEYEEIERTIEPGEQIFLYSDGITEAHNPQGEMYEFSRLKELLRAGCTPEEILAGLYAFTGEGWEQEDDITMLVLRREVAGVG